MNVKEIMTQGIEMIQPSDTLVQAAKKMEALNVGILPVKEENKIVGVVTDRDIVLRALAKNKQAETTRVKDVMSSRISRCSAADSVEDAARIMKENKVRRLIVLDNENRPIGIVTLGDIAAKAKSEQLAGETLDAVSQPCGPAR